MGFFWWKHGYDWVVGGCNGQRLINLLIIYYLMSSGGLRCADAICRILELNGVKFVFGHPGEQILPFYDALRSSSIDHVLMRHEQGAVHAADGYARASSNFGVCVATAGPGALNLVMGVATAFKDSVPLIVITGDVSRDCKGKNVFQDIDLNAVFKPITLETFYIGSGLDGVLKLERAIELIKYNRTGPVHLNFPKDVFDEVVSEPVGDDSWSHPSFDGVEEALKLIRGAEKPLILAGTGVIWAHAVDKLRHFAYKNSIPVTTTYSARGVLPEDDPLCLGMIGLRGTTAANFAGKNCDLLIALGCRFSERTRLGIGDTNLIHVNLDPNVLEGDVRIHGDAGQFLDMIMDVGTMDLDSWLEELGSHRRSCDIKTNYNDVPLKPQRAIREILDASDHLTTVSDAGTHTTWVNLLKTIVRPCELIFSGGFGPMGYGLPAAIGAYLATNKRVVLVTGDGGIQMTLEELAVIGSRDLGVVICIINNDCLGIIKQWQEMTYNESYGVDLQNPDFVELAVAYGIKAKRVSAPGDVFRAVRDAIGDEGPYLIDIVVDKEEGIILPKVGFSR